MREQTSYRAIGLGEVLTTEGRKARWLADQVGISESHLSRIVSGERKITLDLASRISGTLKAPLFLLFELTFESEYVTAESAA